MIIKLLLVIIANYSKTLVVVVALPMAVIFYIGEAGEKNNEKKSFVSLYKFQCACMHVTAVVAATVRSTKNSEKI